MFRNTNTQYGSVAKWLHWLTALLFLAAYVGIYFFHWFLDEEGPMRSPFISFHKGVGFSVLVFFVLRLYWRLTNPNPKLPEAMPGWQIKASHCVHFLLYFFMLAMPLSGYIGNRSGVNYGFFSITSFRDTGLGIWIADLFNSDWTILEVPFDYFHYNIAGPYLLWMLIAAHAGAAIYHHVVHKDDVLTRMLPEKSKAFKDVI